MTTGKLVWWIKDVISTSALMDRRLFYLTNDELRAVDVDTAKVIYKTPIEPSIEDYDETNLAYQDYYHVCSDAENKLLYVFLGDSHQVFAFRVNK